MSKATVELAKYVDGNEMRTSMRARNAVGQLLAITALIGSLFAAGSAASDDFSPPIDATKLAQTRPSGIAAKESAALLSSGKWLVMAPSGLAALLDPATWQRVSLPARSAVPRSGATLTLLPTGQVLIFGGTDASGRSVSNPEIFDPASESFRQILIPDLKPRSGHTATVLTSGEVLIAGGTPSGDAFLWNPRTNAVRQSSDSMLLPRGGHTATLLSTSPVLLSGGRALDGNPNEVNEIYEPSKDSFLPFDLAASGQVPEPATLSAPPVVAGSVPANRMRNVSIDAWPAVRFSRPLDVKTLNTSTVTLFGPIGAEPIRVTPVEAGRLAFVAPTRQLQPDSEYTLFVRGAAAMDGTQLPFTAIGFHTDVASGSRSGSVAQKTRDLSSVVRTFPERYSVWQPTADNFYRSWTIGKVLPANARHPSLPKGAIGATALAGQVLLQDGSPLSNVSVRIGNVQASTNSAGTFLLSGIPAGHNVLVVDGRSANTAEASFGEFVIGVDARRGLTTELGYPIWMPVIDTANAVDISSPAEQELVVTTPRVPGLELHIPKGAVLRDADGKIVTRVSITPLPVDRPPFPTPDTPGYFTIQPGGAYLETVKGSNKRPGMRLFYPNTRGLPNGAKVDFMSYDPTGRGWFAYGKGTVNNQTNEVEPDSNVSMYGFAGAMYILPGPASPPGCSAGTCTPPTGSQPPGSTGKDGNCKGGSGGGADPADGCTSSENNPSGCTGDPVDCATGLFLYRKADLYLPDVIPINITRQYNSGDSSARNFGKGMTHPYHMWLYDPTAIGSSPGTLQTVYLVQASGSMIEFDRTSAGTGLSGAVLSSTSTPTTAYTATITYDGQNLNLKYKTGYTYQFSTLPGMPLQAIIAPSGQKLTIDVDFSKTDRPVLGITSPHGRSVSFTYDPASTNRIASITDNAGRTVSYRYDSSGRLDQVTYPETHNGNPISETYSYEVAPSTQMTSVTNGNGHSVIQNQYTGGRVSLQTRADSGTYQYVYQADASGNITQTTVTDPRGYVQRMSFSSGYLIQDVKALGTPIQQTTSYTRDAAKGYRVADMVDPRSRTTHYNYDSLGNLSSVTQLYGTASAVTTSYTYDSRFSTVRTVTDPLNRVTTFNYDAAGNLIEVVDPLLHLTKLDYYPDSLLKSVTDPLGAGHTTSFSYTGASLSSVTDAIGRTTTLTPDAVGRVLSVVDPAGSRTSYQYDQLDRVKVVSDALNQSTTIGYDAVGNVLSVLDARQIAATNFAYTATELPASRTNPLGATETYDTYDKSFNLTQSTDRKGQKRKYVYDELDRLTKVQFAVPATGKPPIELTYTWDNGNRLTQISQAIKAPGLLGQTTTTAITRAYDELDRLLSETTPAGTVSYTYYANGLRKTMTTPVQGTLNYCYDAANRLTTIMTGSNCASPSGVQAAYGYDNANRRTSLTLANGVITSYGYDNANQLTSLTYSKGGSTLGTLTYGYDAVGRRTRVGGSLARTGLPAAITSASYNANNQLTAWNGANLIYDANGNLTSDGTHTYVWNERDQLAVIDPNSVRVGLTRKDAYRFGYDALNRRSSKSLAEGTPTNYLYDGLNKVQEYSGTTAAATYTTGLGIDETYTRADSTGTVNLIADGLGSTNSLTSNAGAIQTSYTYEPYGETSQTGTASNNDVQYTGRENDGSGLYYYRARYYSPGLKRFIAEDPIGLGGGANIYAYVGGDPISYIDPTGLWRGPDFVNFQINVYVFSVWGTFSRDGSSFVGGGFNRIYPNPLSLEASASAGWLNSECISPGQVDNFLSGYAGAAGAAYAGLGGGVLWSPGNGTATVVGVGAGASLGGTSRASGSIGSGVSFNQGSTGIAW